MNYNKKKTLESPNKKQKAKKEKRVGCESLKVSQFPHLSWEESMVTLT